VLWWEYGLLGSAGGLIVEALSVYLYLTAWVSSRRTVEGKVKADRPMLREYLDVEGHVGIGLARAVLGFVSAAVFAGLHELRGGAVAVALGFAGPGLLSRLGDLGESAAGELSGEFAPRQRSLNSGDSEILIKPGNPEGGFERVAGE